MWRVGLWAGERGWGLAGGKTHGEGRGGWEGGGARLLWFRLGGGMEGVRLLESLRMRMGRRRQERRVEGHDVDLDRRGLLKASIGWRMGLKRQM